MVIMPVVIVERHTKGVCRKPVPGATTTNDQNTTPRKEWMPKQATENYFHKMVALETKKRNKKEKENDVTVVIAVVLNPP